LPKDNKKVYLYSNPSNKRIGYFYDGKLWSVKELSIKTGINENTLYSRLAKYDIYKAITGV
jgi:transcriptional regulator of acetoin/glycerol metabolism